MKKRLGLFALSALLIAACVQSEENVFAKTKLNSISGDWIWIETTGEKIDGLPFLANPSSEGYSLTYSFYDANGNGTNGELKTYKNNVEDIIYLYKTRTNGSEQLLDLEKKGDNALETVSFEIASEDGHTYLLLKQKECCDHNYESRFEVKKKD